MIVCPRCASAQLTNTIFCDQCGEELAEGDGPGASVHFTTVRIELLDSRRSFTLPDLPELVLGRAASGDGSPAEMSLDPYGGKEGGVSRRHARLSRRGLHLYLEDLGSLNGTFVNERRLPPSQPIRIYPGDIIRLGLLRVTFNLSSYQT